MTEATNNAEVKKLGKILAQKAWNTRKDGDSLAYPYHEIWEKIQKYGFSPVQAVKGADAGEYIWEQMGGKKAHRDISSGEWVIRNPDWKKRREQREKRCKARPQNSKSARCGLLD